eukprot:4212310-Amphidinium_carterae.1
MDVRKHLQLNTKQTREPPTAGTLNCRTFVVAPVCNNVRTLICLDFAHVHKHYVPLHLPLEDGLAHQLNSIGCQVGRAVTPCWGACWPPQAT